MDILLPIISYKVDDYVLFYSDNNKLYEIGCSDYRVYFNGSIHYNPSSVTHITGIMYNLADNEIMLNVDRIIEDSKTKFNCCLLDIFGWGISDKFEGISAYSYYLVPKYHIARSVLGGKFFDPTLYKVDYITLSIDMLKLVNIFKTKSYLNTDLGSSPFSFLAALIPAISPCAAASS